jgi:hypothetical protein
MSSQTFARENKKFLRDAGGVLQIISSIILGKISENY